MVVSVFRVRGLFLAEILYRFFFSGGVTLLFFSIFFFHFWIASHYLGLNPPDDVLFNPDKRRRFKPLPMFSATVQQSFTRRCR
jgi:hypothetical protein